jgi:hypothetical protein
LEELFLDKLWNGAKKAAKIGIDLMSNDIIDEPFC